MNIDIPKFRMSPKQVEAIRWLATAQKFLFLAGAVRSGKSFSMHLGWLLWSHGYFKTPQQFIMAGHSIGSIKRNVFPDMQGLADLLGISWQFVHGGSYVISGKHEYHLFGSSDKDAVDKVRGMTAAGMYADEIVLMDQEFLAMAISRLSVPGAKIIASCNPTNPGHYIKTDYIDRIDDLNGTHIKFGLEDNPSLSDEYKGMLKQTLTGADYERLINGEWVSRSGLCYPNYTTQQRVDKFKRWTVAIDYSTSGTIAMLLIGKNGDRSTVVDEYYHTATAGNGENVLTSDQKTDEEITADLTKFLAKHRLAKHQVTVLPDPSAASFKRVLQQNGYTVYKANNDILDGIRVANVALAGKYVTISKKCKILISELETYMRDGEKAAEGEDKPVKTDKHHGVDALRYYCYRYYKWLTNFTRPITKAEGY